MRRLSVAALLGAVVCLAEGVHAGSVSAGTTLFEANRWRGTFTMGSGQGTGNTYMVAGLGLGYFVANGLELGFDGEAWIGSSPRVYKLTPGIRYVVSKFDRFWPYVGVFYRRTLYDGLDDLNSYGGRYGAYMAVSRNAYAGVGGVYEKFANCDDNLYDSCSSSYPEVSLSFSF